MTTKTNRLRIPVAIAATVLAASMLSLTTPTKPAEAAFPGANGKIVFVSSRTTGAGVNNPTGDSEIFTMNPDGTGRTQLTFNTVTDSEPAYSPNSMKIAFVSNRHGHWEIYTMKANGSNPTRLTNNSASDIAPAYSPDGKQIAFQTDRDGDEEIYTMNTDGSNLQNRSHGTSSTELDPTFAPDGSLAFASNFVSDSSQEGDFEIYNVGPYGGLPFQMTNNSTDDLEPDFSPDGTKMAFTRELSDINWEVYTMDVVGGGNVTRLTYDTRSDSSPTYAPNGKQIAFGSARDNNFDVYTMRPDGSNLTKRTNNAAYDGGPDWQSL
jgi:Tol biopolymer transport system component